MEKLELKQIQSYPMGKDGVKILLPKHRLKHGQYDTLPLNGVAINCGGELQLEMLLPDNDILFTGTDVDINRCKLVLRDLSALTKMIDCPEVMGEMFMPMEWLHKNYIGETMFKNPAIWSHRAVSKLLEWHFDVFGLIEKNLAVDINAL